MASLTLRGHNRPKKAFDFGAPHFQTTPSQKIDSPVFIEKILRQPLDADRKTPQVQRVVNSVNLKVT